MLAARMLLLGMLMSLLLTGCKTPGLLTEASRPGHAEEDLAQAIKIYEDGDYTTAAVIFQHALQNGLGSKHDQAQVYKYLAFIHCISDREKPCHDAFKKAFEIDPAFKLLPAEAGHPVWGPVFRAVQSGQH